MVTNLELRLKNSKQAANKGKNKNKQEDIIKTMSDEENDDVNDYERYNIIDAERHNIAKILADQVFPADFNVAVSINGVKNQNIGERFRQGARRTDFFEVLQLVLQKSIVDMKGVARIAGDIDNPLLYITQAAVLTWDKSKKNHIKKLQTSFQINDGAETATLVQETYDWKTGILKSIMNNDIGNVSKSHNISHVFAVPYFMFIPAKNPYNGRARSFFEYIEHHELYANALFNKKITYAELVNYHILPDKATLKLNGGIKLWKKKLKNLLILRKDQMNQPGGSREQIEKIEPNASYLTEIAAEFSNASKISYDGVGIQNPAYQGTKQMSEHEVKVLKAKEEIVVNKLKREVEQTLEYILSFYIDCPFEAIEVKLESKEILTKNDIDNKRFEAEQRSGDDNASKNTPT